jgi:hypothetical protein
LTHTTFSCVKKNEFFYLLQPLQMNFFQIDPSVVMEMCRLQTITWWDVHTFHDSHVVIYSFNTRSLLLHRNDVSSDYNLKIAHILCLNETCFNALTFNNTSLNIDTRTHSMISVNDWNGTMIIYDNFMTTLSSLRAKYIATTFNANTRKVVHIVAIYWPSTLSLSMFTIHL